MTDPAEETDVENDGTPRLGGRWIVLPLVVVTTVVAIVFVTIQLSGRGSAKRNYYALHFTAGLRDLDDGAYTDAVRNLTPVVEEGENPQAAGFRGEAYLQLKAYRRAEADFRLAIEQEPGRPANYTGLAIALAEQQKYREAQQAITGARERFQQLLPDVPHQVPRTGDTVEEVEQWQRRIESRLSPAERADDAGEAATQDSSAHHWSRQIDIVQCQFDEISVGGDRGRRAILL